MKNGTSITIPAYKKDFKSLHEACDYITKNIPKENRYRIDITILENGIGETVLTKINCNLFVKVYFVIKYNREKPFWWNLRAYNAASFFMRNNKNAVAK